MWEEARKNARILIVDDEKANVVLLESILRGAGYRNCRSVTDSRQVLPLFIEFQPDLILLDLHMLPLDGFAVLKQLVPRFRPGAYLPILILTADISEEARRKALSMGAKDFVLKPFAVAEVLLRIANLLDTRVMYLQLQNHNQTLEKRVRERTTALEEAQIEILERLALAAEYRDDETGEHTRRIGRLSGLLAAALGLPDAQVELIRRSAPLHDVGKIVIPDAILMKRDKLTEQEFEVVKAHTYFGARLLSGSRFPMLQLAEEIALTHHEHWDGNGYPLKLVGEAIPLAGRLVAVADVFDAVVSPRPYKEAWPLETAIIVVDNLSGRQLDPQIIQAFLRLHERGELLKPEGEGLPA
jgi:putative two-component system response regulator